MQNFAFYSPTRIFFGQGQIKVLGAQVKQYGSKVLLLYGKNSIKRNGIYDAVVEQLRSQDIPFMELSGVDPNPRLATVIAGANLCREHGLDFILAVGGGSVIDCAKGIAAVTLYDGNPWEFWSWQTRITRALPVGSVLTISATGSEMNFISVVTNEETQEKNGVGSDALFPKFSILDPAYTFTVPPNQTAAGVADILAHVYEFYFSVEASAYLQDSIAEAVMKT
jgi:alcohol dehydrogenase YqhD (iron-dependent ADH family)